jgi:hypothetical protein
MKHQFLNYYVYTQDQNSIVPEKYACQIRPTRGLLGWLQRLAINFLRNTEAITPSKLELKPEYNHHKIRIDTNKLIDSLHSYMIHIQHRYNMRPQKILIGFDIWKEITGGQLKNPEYTVMFGLNQHRPVHVGYDQIEFYGIPIQYVPWISGVVFVPEDK